MNTHHGKTMVTHPLPRLVILCAVFLAPACATDADDAKLPTLTGGAGGQIIGSGGVPASGGTTQTGGAPEMGGVLATGGASSGGASGSGGSSNGSGGSSADEDSGTTRPACLKDADGIALMGGSYVNWPSHTFGADFNAESSLTVQNFAIGGAAMASGGSGMIPPELDTALAKLPKLTTIVMDGGANDVINPDLTQFPNSLQCRNVGERASEIPDCQKIVEKSVAALNALFTKMAKSGVTDVVYFFYPKVPTNTIFGGNNPNGILDYAMVKHRTACEEVYLVSRKADPDAPLNCHYVDLKPVFKDHPDYFAFGDIHPTPAGSKAMAKAVWAKMKDDCVAQPAGSTCCEP